MPNIFQSASFMLPVTLDAHWPVIACDQFTSDRAYWQRLDAEVGQQPSTLRTIIPEVYLEESEDALAARVHAAKSTMVQYTQDGVLKTLDPGYVYVERTLQNHEIRRGLVGIIDLEAYDASADAKAMVRPTEKTVPERIPPRMRLRREAFLDFSHVLLFADDPEDILLGTLEKQKVQLPLLYDFDLMEDGGHICGYQVSGTAAEALTGLLKAYEQAQTSKHPDAPLLYAIGDGNHSLAAAKACYEEKKQARDPAANACRYATVELINLQDASLHFEPIHRLVMDADIDALLQYLQDEVCTQDGETITWQAGDKTGTLKLNPALGTLPISILQTALDTWLSTHSGKIDYIHDEDALLGLAQGEHRIGFLLPPLAKGQFFEAIAKDGVFPRKTFSIGHAREKRYYMETRPLQ